MNLPTNTEICLEMHCGGDPLGKVVQKAPGAPSLYLHIFQHSWIFVRPIVSGSEWLTEAMGTYVEQWAPIKESGCSHPSFLEDTPDFLRHIEALNGGPPLDPWSILATINMKGLYTVIQQKEGVKSLLAKLEQRETQPFFWIY